MSNCLGRCIIYHASARENMDGPGDSSFFISMSAYTAREDGDIEEVRSVPLHCSTTKSRILWRNCYRTKIY
jgi:hypothetical protein